MGWLLSRCSRADLILQLTQTEDHDSVHREILKYTRQTVRRATR